MKTAECSTVHSAQMAQVTKPGAKLEITKRQVVMSSSKHVIIKILACGVCHSDSFPMEGTFPGLKYPIVPGHEIVGIVEEAGPDCQRLKKGDRVGVGWHAGHCGECPSCRAGDFITCKKLQTPGITCDGGYAEYASFPEEACAAVPAQLDACEAAPLLCAGVTTFNALRHSGARPGDLVAIVGLGGLGHLGVQFAAKMGFNTVGIARGDEKAEFAKKLGAHSYINSQSKEVGAELQKLGGAKVALATVTDSAAMAPLINGLCVDGTLMIVGAGMQPLPISPVQLLGSRLSVRGWPSGTSKDSEDCMQFAALSGVKAQIERFAFKDVTAAYEHMMSGKARFRAVLDFSKS
jgi:D-arabinose 1-dehydrogenase-like Zn-dependent alcohol dehydrogenase